MSEFEQNLCCGSESEEANLASLKETLSLPGLRPVDVKRALCLYALRYGRSSKLNPREVQIVAESKSICFGIHGLFLIRGIVKIELVLPLTKIMIFI